MAASAHDTAISPRQDSHNADADIVSSELIKGPTGFRRNALALVSYPWTTGVVMCHDLSKIFDEDHYAFVSVLLFPLLPEIHDSPSFQSFSSALQDFDTKIAAMSHTSSFLRTALRDVGCDRYSDKTQAEIVSSEWMALQRSVGHASEVCSLLTACRVMDIIYMLDSPENDALSAPIHERLQVDFSSFRVSHPFSLPSSVIAPIFPRALKSLGTGKMFYAISRRGSRPGTSGTSPLRNSETILHVRYMPYTVFIRSLL